MIFCPRCNAVLSAWEIRHAEELGVGPCWCDGVPRGVSHTLANVAYAELCHAELTRPVKTHDIVRFVGSGYAGDARYSINVALSQSRRFCWGGRALYGLARHGPIPGARSLPEAAYAILLAAPRPLHIEEIDFILEQMNYRFNSDSLLHHLRGYTGNRWDLSFNIDYRNRVWVDAGTDARHDYNAKVAVCPTDAGFDGWIDDEFAPRVERILEDRARRLADLSGGKLQIAGDRIEFT